MAARLPSQAQFWEAWERRDTIDKVMCGSAVTACLSARATFSVTGLQVLTIAGRNQGVVLVQDTLFSLSCSSL